MYETPPGSDEALAFFKSRHEGNPEEIGCLKRHEESEVEQLPSAHPGSAGCEIPACTSREAECTLASFPRSVCRTSSGLLKGMWALSAARWTKAATKLAI